MIRRRSVRLWATCIGGALSLGAVGCSEALSRVVGPPALGPAAVPSPVIFGRRVGDPPPESPASPAGRLPLFDEVEDPPDAASNIDAASWYWLDWEEGGHTAALDNSTAAYLSASMSYAISVDNGPDVNGSDGCWNVLSSACSWSTPSSASCAAHYVTVSENTSHYIRWVTASASTNSVNGDHCGQKPPPGGSTLEDGYACDWSSDSYFEWDDASSAWVVDGGDATLVCEEYAT